MLFVYMIIWKSRFSHHHRKQTSEQLSFKLFALSEHKHTAWPAVYYCLTGCWSGAGHFYEAQITHGVWCAFFHEDLNTFTDIGISSSNVESSNGWFFPVCSMRRRFTSICAPHGMWSHSLFPHALHIYVSSMLLILLKFSLVVKWDRPQVLP